jgi:hypothetical protein
MIIQLSNMKILKLIWIRYLSVSDFIRKNTLPVFMTFLDVL